MKFVLIALVLLSIALSCFDIYAKREEYVDYERVLRESITPKDLPEEVIKEFIEENQQYQYRYERFEKEIVRLMTKLLVLIVSVMGYRWVRSQKELPF